jgi:cell division protein FtsL
MIRITTLLWVALLVVAGGTVMHVSYQVRHVEQRLSELNRDTRLEQDKLRILGAEWDTLNDPQRIDQLAKRHLTLEATPIARVVALDAIPLKLSDEQLAAAPLAKGQKAQAPASLVAAKKPDIVVKAPAPAQDGVGLILARMEKHE